MSAAKTVKERPFPYPEELAHLAGTHRALAAALAEAEAAVARLEADYMEAKLYMVQNRGEIDPHEMFQNELALGEIDSSGAFAARRLEQLAKLRDSPYFARIDFCPAGGQPAGYYIGRFAFSHQGEPLILDWRAPLASMFYDQGLGPAYYDAPGGRVAGELRLKRQFRIKNGVLEYALDSPDSIRDEVLQRELAATTSRKMRSIIATIQKEQNAIIRNQRAETLIIQGVAGSGKTSIALHRVAWLMYRLGDRLRARNITILSPNRVFGDYISTVLPELGEEPIFQAGPGDIAEAQLEKGMSFAPEPDPLETGDAAWAERVAFKSTADFLARLEAYAAGLGHTAFEARELRFEPFFVTAQWIEARLEAYGRHPLLKRLEMIAGDIHERFEADNRMGDELPRPGAILKGLKAMLRFKSTLALYRNFYRWLGEPRLFVPAGKKTLEWNDVFPFLYLQAAFTGLQESGIIRHLVIDEMQDYTPVQHAVLGRLFRCRKTILGDFGQMADPNHQHSLEDVLRLYPGAEFVELRQSYRSTSEIIRFAAGLWPGAGARPVERHGAEPAVTACRSEAEELARLKQLIAEFRRAGQGSLGILVQTNGAARALHEKLGDPDTELITPESRRFSEGVSIAPVRLAKGLEFDTVVIPGASRAAWHTEHHRRLLYIACTRALHRLELLYTGAPAPFLPR